MTADVRARLALDRYLMGVWSERELAQAHEQQPLPARIVELSALPAPQRPKGAEAIRQELFGAPRPGEVEQLEALLREGVDRAEASGTILRELQVDLQVRAKAVPRDDPRAAAVRCLAILAAASQVNVAVQGHGPLAEATRDRVAQARAAALAELSELLRGLPHLAPG